jgi:hypothetical protein
MRNLTSTEQENLSLLPLLIAPKEAEPQIPAYGIPLVLLQYCFICLLLFLCWITFVTWLRRRGCITERQAESFITDIPLGIKGSPIFRHTNISHH